MLAPFLIFSSSCAAVDIPPPPVVGSCTDCIGELNGTLNACTLSSASCVSTQNEDEDHFMAPWQYNSSTEAAVDRLIAVATGTNIQCCNSARCLTLQQSCLFSPQHISHPVVTQEVTLSQPCCNNLLEFPGQMRLASSLKASRQP